jgi:hypothetical protein
MRYLELFDQSARTFWHIGCGVARLREICGERNHARWHIESDGIRGAAGLTRIVGHQNGDAPLAPRRSLQPHKRGDAIGDHRDAVRLRPIGERGKREAALRRQRLLKCDGAREHAPVQLGQNDMHRKIGRAKSARAVAPGRPLGVRDYRLQHRNVGSVERGRSLRPGAGGERRRRHDHRWVEARERVTHEIGAVLVFEAGDDQRRGVEAARAQRFA